MNIEHRLEKEVTNDKLFLFLSDGEPELEQLADVDANIVKCHISSEGHDITQDELYSEKNVNHLMSLFVDIIKSYQNQTRAETVFVLGCNRNAEVALDLLLKENELIDGGILIKPILNIAITDGIRIEDGTKVLIIGGDEEADFKQVEERDIADILGVNGYEVTLLELDEGEALTTEDVNQSMEWIHQKFYTN